MKIDEFINKALEKKLLRFLSSMGKYVSDWVSSESKHYWTDATYNLKDSIGSGLYKDGALIKFIGNPASASISTTYIYHKQMYNMSGRNKLMSALQNNHLSNTGKYVLAVFCEAPYGFFLEHGLGPDGIDAGDSSKKGYGWWSEGLVPYINEKFELELKAFENEIKFGK
ncbi:MAG: hypothetical protein RRY36_09615 [Bacteroidaceae bacterium]